MKKNRAHLIFVFVFILITLAGCMSLKKAQIAPASDEIKQTSAPYHYSLSVILRQEGQLEEATDELKQALAADPESSYLATELISLYAEQGDFNQAIAQGEEALSKNSDNVELHLIMGGLYLNIREYAKAIREQKSH
ncbi:MAG: tetratricopeptide repeat protein [Smithella sp.]|jgi:tetratricopeptide (TPR) repeat protein